ncbi:MAG TPA: class I SAM-dependent methyltransferase [Egibacteraceae bacterium]|nr:class I SAM-dependent methyltransferase [Actinomycetota bacterium]HWB73136.1 class I SAM-dependent methyltransferase [Egibacteraceae bacterium]
MTATPNPPAFEEAVNAHLESARGQFNYDQMALTFLSTDRFRRWARVVDRYRPVPGSRFLSSGCGLAGSLPAYRDAGAAVAVGVDVDQDYLRIGALRVAALGAAGVVAYDGRRLPFRAGAFDLIESIDVIEHTPDPRAYLAELRRVLAPDGLILLVTPNRLWPVEQHLQVVGPPWLPVRSADSLFSALARLPLVGEDRRFRYRRLRGMRTHNLSLRRLRALAKQLGLFLRLLRPADHADHWPLPRDGPLLERLAHHRVGKFLAPVRTLVLALTHDRSAAAPGGWRDPARGYVQVRTPGGSR